MPNETKNYGTVITTAGAALIAKCILNGGKVNIKTAAAGDGGGEYYEPTVAQTALRGKKWEGDVASAAVSTTNANMIDVKITIDDSVGGFTIREMGLFDDDGTLIAICNTPDTEKVSTDGGVSGKLTMIMHIVVPLATDLLDYTIQRVKVKEPQYTKVKAYVMENGQMVEKELFEKIKDDGKPHFPKSQTFHMCADMQRMASAILQKCNSADGRYFETEYEERLKDLDDVIVLCDTLNQYINLSYKRKYISGDQCHYWAELVRPVRQKAFNWKRNDSNRAAALREAKANQELAKMGQMAQQIAEALARNP